MYRGRPWTIRQYAGFASAEESNERYRYLLERGQTGLSVAFDLPTQLGYDSDDAVAEGEVGRTGVAIDSIADMELLLDGIPLGEVSTSMTINAPAALLLLLYELVAEQQGVPGSALRGTVQNDILKEYVARGNYIFPPRPSMRLTTDLFAYCEERIPRWNTISISGYHIREAGSTAVQELAFTLANGIAYCEAAVAAGLSPDAFGARLSFFFNAHNDFFQEVAKFRAARTAVGADHARPLRRHDQAGAGAPLPRPDGRLDAHRPTTREQHRQSCRAGTLGRLRRRAVAPHEQLRRGARAAQRARGDDRPPHPAGADARGRDDRHRRPARGLATTSRRSPPSSSSTRRELIERVDELGGAVAAVEAGFVQGEIEESAYRFQTAVESGARVVVGVNEFTQESATDVELHRVDPAGEQRQRERTARVRAERNAEAAAAALAAVRETAAGSRATSCHPCAKRYARAARSARSAARSASSGERTTAGEHGRTDS